MRLVIEILFGILIVVGGIFCIVKSIMNSKKGIHQNFSDILGGRVLEASIYEVYARCVNPTGGNTMAFLLDMAHKGFIKILKKDTDIYIKENEIFCIDDENTKQLFNCIFESDAEYEDADEVISARTVPWEKACVRYNIKSEEIASNVKHDVYERGYSPSVGYSSTIVYGLIECLLFACYIGALAWEHDLDFSSFLSYMIAVIAIEVGLPVVVFVTSFLSTLDSRYGNEPYVGGVIGAVLCFSFSCSAIMKFADKFHIVGGEQLLIYILALVTFGTAVTTAVTEKNNRNLDEETAGETDTVNIIYDAKYSDENAGSNSNVKRLRIFKAMLSSQHYSKLPEVVPEWYEGSDWRGESELMDELRATLSQKVILK